MWFLLIILGYQAVIYFLAPVYHFPEPVPFHGIGYYNPYQGLDSTGWRKSNFHFHVKEWGGLTAGRNNTPEEFYRVYKWLNYDAPQISNYQSISEVFKDSAFYIPTYEHGFGVRKKHQILIGARSVLWLDYSLFQNRHHKQHIIDLLRPDNGAVAIAHPDWEGGYSLDDMKYLSNYDLLEVLDNNWRSIPQWDAALSAGRPVWILADDDAHNIDDRFQIMRCATFIHSDVLQSDSMVASLKNGRAYGMEIYMGDYWTWEMKASWAKRMPKLRSVKMVGDTLKVDVSGDVFKTVFIGQDGKVRKSVYGGGSQWYLFTPTDTYIRTEITFIAKHAHPKLGRGDIMYLNPVIRSDTPSPYNDPTAEIDWVRTWIFRVMSFGSVILIFLFFWRMRKNKKSQAV